MITAVIWTFQDNPLELGHYFVTNHKLCEPLRGRGVLWKLFMLELLIQNALLALEKTLSKITSSRVNNTLVYDAAWHVVIHKGSIFLMAGPSCCTAMFTAV